MDKTLEDTISSFISDFKTNNMVELQEREPTFLKIKSFDCRLNNGTSIIREQILRGDTDGHVVTVLPVTLDNKIVMVAQPRVFTPLTVGFELPAGYVENDEDPLMAARRELLEETGYQPLEMEKLISYHGDPGCSKAINHCYVATGCEKVYDQVLDDSEYVGFFECSLDEASEMLDSGLIVGSSSIITLQKVYGKRGRYGI